MPQLRFKEYNQNQRFLFPSSLDEMILPNHPVHIVSEIIDRIEWILSLKNIKTVELRVIIPGCF